MGALARNARTVMEYTKRFRGGLNHHVLNDLGYSFCSFLVPKVVNRANSADAAIEFAHIDQANDEQKAWLDQLTVLIKDRQIPVANLDKRKPKEIVDTVSGAIPYVFNMHHHTTAWKHFKVRPAGNSNRPEQTTDKYCVYDSAHKDYLYTNAWTDKLIRELSDPEKFHQITGKPPKTK